MPPVGTNFISENTELYALSLSIPPESSAEKILKWLKLALLAIIISEGVCTPGMIVIFFELNNLQDYQNNQVLLKTMHLH